MALKTVYVEIQGVSPLIINRFKEQDEIPVKVEKGKKDYGTPKEQAELTAYCEEPRKAISKLWIPTSWLSGCIKSVASDFKIPGKRKSFKSVCGGAILPMEELVYFLEGYKLKHIEIDSRPVVIQGKDRIMRHRAKLTEWNLGFNIEIDTEIVDIPYVKQILEDAGRRAGMGDYRPAKSGPFGRFMVTEFKETTKAGRTYTKKRIKKVK